MPSAVKLATCCYCGAKTALAFPKGAVTALSCASCSAPLQRLKAIKLETPAPEKPAPAPPRRSKKRPQNRRSTPSAKKRERQHAHRGLSRPQTLWGGRDHDQGGEKEGEARRRRYRDGPRRKSRKNRRKKGPSARIRSWFAELIDEIEDLFD